MGEVAETQPAEAIVQVIERAAMNPDVDIDKMERLLQMQERVMDRNAEQAFTAAMVQTQRMMPVIQPKARNEQTRSSYAKLDNINKLAQPVYTEHGFSCVFGEADSPKEDCIRIVCDLSHEQGHTRRYHYDVPLDLTGLKGNQNKTRTHASGSSASYGRRYLTIMMFNLTIGDDDDGNAAGSTLITEEQAAEIELLLASTKSDKALFLKMLKVSNVESIGLTQYGRAIAALNKKAKAEMNAST